MISSQLKTQGTESLMSFLNKQHLTCVATTHCQRMYVLCNCTGRCLLEAYTWFPLEFFPCIFFFAGFVLYHFAIRSHSSKCDYMLSPVSLPSESVNGGGLLDADPVVIAHVTLNVHFPAGYWCWTSFHGLFAICISSLWTVFHDFSSF